MVGQQYFKGGKRTFEGAKIYYYNKIDNSENFRGEIAASGALSLLPLVAGLVRSNSAEFRRIKKCVL